MVISMDYANTLHFKLGEWLERKQFDLEKLKDRALKALQHEKNDWTHGQYDYARNAVSAVKWLRSQVPSRFKNIYVADEQTSAAIFEMVNRELGAQA